MIVVDTNIIACFYLPNEFTDRAEQLQIDEPVWAAPILWRSGMRNVLALYIRKNLLSLEHALEIQAEAESLMKENEFESNSQDVLRLVHDSSCSAYDCEFVALARTLGTKLATLDKRILENFPDTAISLPHKG